MQVSWIDADEVRDLVALLAEPPARSGSGAPDLSTLPESADRFGFEFLSEKPAAAAWPGLSLSEAPRQAPAAVEAALQPDISLIREKLRVIRDRAHEAGLLAKDAPETAPPPAPLAAPPPPPVAAAPMEFPAPQLRPLPPAAVVIEPPAAASEPESSGSPPDSPAGTPTAPPSAAEATEAATLVERLDEFALASAKQTHCEEQFLLDDHGDLLWGAPTSPDLLICAKLAMNASMRSQAATLATPGGATQVHVAPGKDLQLVYCPTPHGGITLTLVNARQVPAAELREQLAQAMGR